MVIDIDLHCITFFHDSALYFSNMHDSHRRHMQRMQSMFDPGFMAIEGQQGHRNTELDHGRRGHRSGNSQVSLFLWKVHHWFLEEIIKSHFQVFNKQTQFQPLLTS